MTPDDAAASGGKKETPVKLRIASLSLLVAACLPLPATAAPLKASPRRPSIPWNPTRRMRSTTRQPSSKAADQAAKNLLDRVNDLEKAFLTANAQSVGGGRGCSETGLEALVVHRGSGRGHSPKFSHSSPSMGGETPALRPIRQAQTVFRIIGAGRASKAPEDSWAGAILAHHPLAEEAHGSSAHLASNGVPLWCHNLVRIQSSASSWCLSASS